MKILITGICGFVGSTLAKAWLEAEPGVAIYGLDNFIRPGSEQNRQRSAEARGQALPRRYPQRLRFRGACRPWTGSSMPPPIPACWPASTAQTSSRQLIEHNLLGPSISSSTASGTGPASFCSAPAGSIPSPPLAEVAVEPRARRSGSAPDRSLPPGLSCCRGQRRPSAPPRRSPCTAAPSLHPKCWPWNTAKRSVSRSGSTVAACSPGRDSSAVPTRGFSPTGSMPGCVDGPWPTSGLAAKASRCATASTRVI